jgi:hypothetical protein
MRIEIRRELKVSELAPRTVVVVAKPGVAAATMWVMEITARFVHFYAGIAAFNFIAKRCGPDLDEVTDNSGAPMKLYEFVGEL